MVVGARRTGMSISQTADLLGFSHTTISSVYREWSEKEKISSERQLRGWKCLVDVRGQRRMDRLEPWSRWAPAAEDHTGCRSCQIRTGHGGYNSHRFTKIGQQKMVKTLPGLMSLDFCCNIQMLGSVFGVKNMKAWIHHVLSQRFRLVKTSQSTWVLFLTMSIPL